MKKIKSVCLGVVVLLPFFLVACNMSLADSFFTSIAQGAELPVEYAIASGDTGLMLGCLAGLEERLNSGSLSEKERGEIALDMVDLLAVLSNSMNTLFPYLLEDSPPEDLSQLESFFATDTAAEYLIRIAENKLMEYALYAAPSPMQLFWGILGLVIQEDIVNGGDFTTLNQEQRNLYETLVVRAEQKAEEGTNPDFLPVLNQLRALFGETP